MRLKTAEETQEDLMKCGTAAIALAKKLENDAKLEALVAILSPNTPSRPMTDEAVLLWMKAYRVLYYAEGLVPQWKRAQLENLRGYSLDARTIEPEFRDLVLRAHAIVDTDENKKHDQLTDRLVVSNML